MQQSRHDAGLVQVSLMMAQMSNVNIPVAEQPPSTDSSRRIIEFRVIITKRPQAFKRRL